ncbi:GerAB/ArcD/ProY family transporter [Vallitalea maricola]|uniref:GerAB/ArcD/ProY family transporter n=1 Tax=Vallitalea maricola TaxID=3074433 RepID=A0ACB5UMX3_9FIRM|nr:GerAB/ArcD/ProY family transporter [Vallitalea sp. AN17-2]
MKDTLTNKQIAFIVFGATAGYAIISLPKSIGETAGTGGWIFIVIGICTMIISSYVIVYLGHSFPNKTIFEYMPLLTGKIISSLIIIIIIIYEIIAYSFIIRLTSETIKLTMLIQTPVWALAVLIGSVAFYTLTKSLITLGRIAEIFGLIVIIWAIAITITIFTQGNLTNIKPIFEFRDIDYIEGLSVAAFSMVGIDLITVIPINKANKKLFRHVLIILLIVCLIYVLIIESCISIMGIENIVHYDETLYATVRRIELADLQFLKRLDSVFIIVWLMAVYCSILYEAYIATTLFSKLVKGKKNNILLLTLFLSLIVCLAPPSIEITKNILRYASYVGVFINVILPFILLILLIIKKHRKKISTEISKKYYKGCHINET